MSQDIEAKRSDIIDKALNVNYKCHLLDLANLSNLLNDKQINFLKKHELIVVDKRPIVIDENTAVNYFGVIPLNLPKLFKTVKGYFVNNQHYVVLSDSSVSLEYSCFKNLLKKTDNSISNETLFLFETIEKLLNIYREYELRYDIKHLVSLEAELSKEIKTLKEMIKILNDKNSNLEEENGELRKLNTQITKELEEHKPKQWFITRWFHAFMQAVFKKNYAVERVRQPTPVPTSTNATS